MAVTMSGLILCFNKAIKSDHNSHLIVTRNIPILLQEGNIDYYISKQGWQQSDYETLAKLVGTNQNKN